MPVNIFFCYAREDETLLNKLKAHLKPLQHLGFIDLWHDRDISAGTEWEHEINQQLNRADVILLLISPDFMNSDYCYGTEMKQAMELHEQRQALVIPIILRPVHWQGTSFAKLQILPRDAKPVISWADQDDAFFNVTEDILKAVAKPALSSSIGTYSKWWHSHSSGCLIFLLDQSEATSLSFNTEKVNDKRVCDIIAKVLNDYLNEIILTNSYPLPDGTLVTKDAVDIAVLGYSNGSVSRILPNPLLANKLFASLSELQMHPLETEIQTRKEVDDTGNVIDIPVPFPIWVKPKAKGNAPMCAALEYAKDLAEKWATTHPDNYPPIVLNLTGGKASDGDPTLSAFYLRQVSTSDGQVLLYNNVLTSQYSACEIEFPHNEAELLNYPHVRELFTISSIIPERQRSILQSLRGIQVHPGAKGLIIASTVSLSRLILPFIDDLPAHTLDPNM